MLKTLLIQESEKQEYYTVDINGKLLHVYIEKGDEGAVSCDPGGILGEVQVHHDNV